MIDLVIVIRLRHSGRMARFDAAGRLAEWTGDLQAATVFRDEVAAGEAVRAICAPEIRAAIRTGHAYRVLDEETGAVLIYDARMRYETPFPNPPIRVDFGPRFLGDDPAVGIEYGDHEGRAARAAALVRDLFREAAHLNWRLQTKPRISPSRIPSREYTTPVSARARHAGALGRFAMSKASGHVAA